MASHRRTEESFDPSVYSTGVSAYGITTDVNAERKSPTVSGYLDYLWGGYEAEDRAATTSPYNFFVDAKGNVVASNTPGGRWVTCAEYAAMTGGKSCEDALVNARNVERGVSDSALDQIIAAISPEPDTTGPRPVPWGKIAAVVGASLLVVVGIQYLPKNEG
jgi:hypothetical protein